MQEIKSKKAGPGNKPVGENDVSKKSGDCSCSCSGADADLDGGFDIASEHPDPSCGCSCGSNSNLDSVLDFTAEGP